MTTLGSQIERMRTIAASGVRALRELMRIPSENARHRPTPLDGLVLDGGGGQSPHPRADAVVDKYNDFGRSRAASLDFYPVVGATPVLLEEAVAANS